MTIRFDSSPVFIHPVRAYAGKEPNEELAVASIGTRRDTCDLVLVRRTATSCAYPMSLWKRGAGDQAAPKLNFRWTELTVAEFQKNFRERAGVGRFDLPAHVTHQCVERSSWDLTTRSFSGRTDQRYFGWFDTHIPWNGAYVDRLPLQLVIETRPQIAYARRSSEDWGSLTPLGSAYLWSRGEDSEDAFHGIEALLFLDARRYRSVRRAIRAHRGAVPPSITLGLRPRVEDAKADDDMFGDRSPTFDVVAYWLTTWPMWTGPASDHPWAAGAGK